MTTPPLKKRTDLTAISSLSDDDDILVLRGTGSRRISKQDLWDSTALTGNPTAPTQTTSDDSTKIATTAFVQANVIDKLPLAGGTLTGALTLDADPTAALHAVTKQYADELVDADQESTDWNNLTSPGNAYVNNGVTNQPTTGLNWTAQTFRGFNTHNVAQMAISTSHPINIFVRAKSGGTWGDWVSLRDGEGKVDIRWHLDSGDADHVQAFQDAINDLPNNVGPHTIVLEAGTYTGDLSTLTFGSREVIWECQGIVTFDTARPEGYFRNLSFLSDNRPWNHGAWGYVRDRDTGDQLPTLDIRRNTDHTSGVSGNVTSAANILSNVLTNVGGGFENGLTVVLEDEAVQSSNPNFCGIQTEARRMSGAAGSTANLFGANILAVDRTGLASIASGAGVVGIEVNVAAEGLDDGDKRILADLLPKVYDNAASTAEFYAGMRIKNTTSGGTTTLKRGISIEEGTGTINRGVHADATQEAFYAAGAPSAVLASLVSNASNLNLGSTRKTVGQTVSDIQGRGYNAADEETIYSQTKTVIGDATDGSEDGQMRFSVLVAGAATEMFRITNAGVSLRTGGSLKAVTEGAADSGGTGFKVLRVAN